jgi:hypothetical protein
MGDEGRMSANADKDLQSLVDQRVAAKMDALQLATVERLEAALQTRFDKDRAFIGETLGFAAKGLGGGISGVASDGLWHQDLC